MIISKLSTKSRTTIPRPVRTALRLAPGDALVYKIDGQCVVLTNAKTARSRNEPFRTFREWSSEADAKAYASL